MGRSVSGCATFKVIRTSKSRIGDMYKTLKAIVAIALLSLGVVAPLKAQGPKFEGGSKLPPLPVEITSFGAAKLGNTLYVYGGHTGGAHSYSNKAQNNRLLALNLYHVDQGWKDVSTGERLQGLGMVAYDKRLIMVGGFTAQNAEGEKQDLHSQSNVRVFDTSNSTWSELAPLPEPRSSHDVALIGDTVYVVGGWNMQGEGNTKWHDTAWAMNLKASKPEWVELPKPSFVRRAVAAIAHQGKLFVVGGMNESGSPTKQVSIFDPASKSWKEVAEIQGEQSMAGFGASGWSLDGKLMVTTFEGSIQSWNDSQGSWEDKGKTKDARFFHRMLPLDDHHLVSIGGANMNVGKYTELEVVSLN